MNAIWNSIFLVDVAQQCVISAFACMGYALICNAPRKELPYCALNGFVGWFVYQLAFARLHQSVAPTLIATMAVTAMARVLSFRREAPSILYHIPGVLPMVPGAAVYDSMISALDGKILETYANILNGLKLAGTIGIGSLLILVLPYSFFAIKFPNRKKKQA